jgi:outer membrane protein OmpA-like peptidoglycan-associated protein
VEGHTDSSGEDAFNIDLSQRRSMSVITECLNLLDTEQKAVSANGNDKKGYFLRVLSASGRGKQDLITKDGVEDAPLSRRVIFKIRVRSFEEKKIEKILTNA